jgi:hypothetical protein
MLATPTRNRTVTRSDETLTASALSNTSRSETNWRYIFLMRAGAYERHTQTCPWCAANRRGDYEAGPCPIGLNLAQRADYAMAAAGAGSPPELPQPPAPLALW